MTGFHKNKHSIRTANLNQLKNSLEDTGTHTHMRAYGGGLTRK